MERHLVTYYGPHSRRLPSIEHPAGCDLETCPVITRLQTRIAAHEEGDQVDGVYETHLVDGEWSGGMRRVGSRF